MLKLTTKIDMESRNIDLQECMNHYDFPIIVGIRARARFVYQGNDVV
jgi:hypothetical protein